MREVFAFIREYRMIEEGDRVIAAVSGGADSVCLFFLLREYQKECAFSLAVVHVEHGIRGEESRADAAFVRELCESQGVPFFLRRVDVPALAKREKLTLEEAGRKARYDAFEEFCAVQGADKIAVAHSQDDQAETVLMNLARGSGLAGLGGMVPVRGKVIRPLLCVRRSRIEAYLTARQISWRTDASNFSADCTRNRVRLQVLPLLEEEVNTRASEHITDAAGRVRRADDYLARTAERIAAQMTKTDGEAVRIARASFVQLDPVMQEYLVRHCLGLLDAARKDISQRHITSVCALAGGKNGSVLTLPGGIRAENQNESLVLLRGTPPKEKPQACPLVVPGVTLWEGLRIETALETAENKIIPEKKYTKWFDYDRIKDTLALRTRETGDYLTVNAQGGTKKLQRYLIEEKILRRERDTLPLIADGAHIVWVIGHRISEAYKADSFTKHLLKIQVKTERKENGR